MSNNKYNIDPVIREYLESLHEMQCLIGQEDRPLGQLKYEIDSNSEYMYAAVRRFEIAFEAMVRKIKND